MLKGDPRLDKSVVPAVNIIHDDLGGSISIASFLDKGTASAIKKEISGKMESDVLMLACSGVFYMENRFMKLNCSVVNEDGMPVSIVESNKIEDINQFIKETRYGVFNIFKSI